MKKRLMDWLAANGSDAAYRQANFVTDRLLPIVGADLDYEEVDGGVFVIGEHRSKSITLPVYEIHRLDIGLRLVMRNNFHDWKLSVDAPRVIAYDFGHLFHTTPPVEPDYTGDPLSDCYFEGFDDRDVFGYYSADARKFSANIYDDFRMWAVIFHIAQALDIVKPMIWGTRAKFEADSAGRKRRMEERKKPIRTHKFMSAKEATRAP